MGGPSIQVHVAAWAGWRTGLDNLVLGGAANARGGLPLSLRRRITAVGRRLMEAAWSVLAEGDAAPRIVLSSRHGEYGRTYDLLCGLAESGEVSPADFSLSVHHALAGLLSIATGNRAGHTALSAGTDTFGYGLLEAAACAVEDARSVLHLHFDEPLPEPYAHTVDDDDQEAVVLACLLTPCAQPGGSDLTMEFEPANGTRAGALSSSFLDFLSLGQESLAATGERHTWRWHRA